MFLSVFTMMPSNEYEIQIPAPITPNPKESPYAIHKTLEGRPFNMMSLTSSLNKAFKPQCQNVGVTFIKNL